MSLENARKYLNQMGYDGEIFEFDQSSATVELAANAIGCKPEQIAKTLSFFIADRPIVIVCAGDAKVDNAKFKHTFQKKAKMIPAEMLENTVGHPAGGVCPFGLKENVEVCLDESLKRFEKVYPAAGSGNSAILCTIDQLQQLCPDARWVDVCKGWQPGSNH